MSYRYDLVHGYQPRWINGETVGAGLRDAEQRYAAIAERLTGRGFTVLDVGSHSAYFALRLADEFGAKATALDGNPDLRAVLEETPHPDVTGDYRYLTEDDLDGLGTYDVGLVLNVLHHIDFPVALLQALAQKCGLLFVETPVPEEGAGAGAEKIAATIDAIKTLGGEVIATTPNLGATHNRPIYRITRPAKKPAAKAPRKARSTTGRRSRS